MIQRVVYVVETHAGDDQKLLPDVTVSSPFLLFPPTPAGYTSTMADIPLHALDVLQDDALLPICVACGTHFRSAQDRCKCNSHLARSLCFGLTGFRCDL